jgi:single-strand DNA-binding protein
MTTNLIRLIGYIGKDLSAATVSTGQRRIQLRIATHYSTVKQGTKEYHTVWHDVVAWGQTAEYAERSFVKGSKIMVEGSIEYCTFPDSTGHIRYYTRVSAHSLMNLDR